MIVCVFLVGFSLTAAGPNESLAQDVSSTKHKVTPPASSGPPPTEVLASDIPLFIRSLLVAAHLPLMT